MLDHEKIERAMKGMVQKHLESKYPGRNVRIKWVSPEMSPSESRAFQLLEVLADRAGDTGTCFNAIKLGKELGFSTAESKRADCWLSEREYVVSGYGFNMAITDSGRDKVETIRMGRFKRRANDLLDRIAQTRDDQLGYSDITAICQHMGWQKVEIDQLLDYLEEEGLIEIIDDGHKTARITSKGINHLGPPTPAQPHVINNSGVWIARDMTGGQVAGRDIIQTTFSRNNLEQLAAFISTVKAQMAELKLPPDEETELTHDLSSLESQLKKKELKPGIIAGIFEGVKTKIQKYATTVIASGIVLRGQEIWAWLEPHIPKTL